LGYQSEEVDLEVIKPEKGSSAFQTPNDQSIKQQ
jgi:hypothetical protein